MSITRSSIPVCITAVPRPSLCVTVAHSSSVPPAIVPPPPVRPRRSSEPPFLQQGPPAQECGAGTRPSLHAAPQKYASHLFSLPPYFDFLFYFLFPSCASLFFTLLDSSLPFPPRFLLAQDAFQHQVAFTALLFLKMVNKTLSLDALETTRHPKVSSTFVEEEHQHPEHKVRTPRFE